MIALVRSFAFGGMVFLGLGAGAAGYTVLIKHHTDFSSDDPPTALHNPPEAEPPPAGPRASDETRRKLRGTWTTLSTVLESIGGQPQAPRRVQNAWVIDGDRITVSRSGDLEKLVFDHEYTFELDPDGPGSIDLFDPGSGLLRRSIYVVDGDRLTICMGSDERPTSFEGHPELGPYLSEFQRVGPEPMEVVERFERAPGCHWAVDPGNFSAVMTRGVSVMTESAPDGALSLVIAHPVRDHRAPGPDFRPVLFDSGGTRFLPEMGTGGWSSDPFTGAMIAHYRYRMDPEILPAGEVENIGVEVLTAEARRIEREEARKRAEGDGLEPLPAAVVGEPFPFSLPAIEGDGRIDAESLRGKVVLIDCWATWCSPCMAKMPELKTTYERYRDSGFEIIGINFDSDLDRAKQSISDLGLDWLHARIPDEEQRELWSAASGISGIPRLFLIDRHGILRGEELSSGPDLDAMVKEWLKRDPQ